MTSWVAAAAALLAVTVAAARGVICQAPDDLYHY